MGRAKIDIKSIKKGRNRFSTYNKRIAGLKKKMKEITVLCDVDACLISFGQRSVKEGVPSYELFPDDGSSSAQGNPDDDGGRGQRPASAEQIINRFRRLQGEQGEQEHKKLDKLGFLNEEIPKLEKMLRDGKKTISELDFPDPPNLDQLSLQELEFVANIVQHKLHEVENRMTMIQPQQQQDVRYMNLAANNSRSSNFWHKEVQQQQEEVQTVVHEVAIPRLSIQLQQQEQQQSQLMKSTIVSPLLHRESVHCIGKSTVHFPHQELALEGCMPSSSTDLGPLQQLNHSSNYVTRPFQQQLEGGPQEQRHFHQQQLAGGPLNPNHMTYFHQQQQGGRPLNPNHMTYFVPDVQEEQHVASVPLHLQQQEGGRLNPNQMTYFVSDVQEELQAASVPVHQQQLEGRALNPKEQQAISNDGFSQSVLPLGITVGSDSDNPPLNTDLRSAASGPFDIGNSDSDFDFDFNFDFDFDFGEINLEF